MDNLIESKSARCHRFDLHSFKEEADSSNKKGSIDKMLTTFDDRQNFKSLTIKGLNEFLSTVISLKKSQHRIKKTLTLQ